MTKFEKTSSFSRRSVLLGGGALVVSVGAAVSLDTVMSVNAAYAQGTAIGAKPPLTPDQLSSYIAVNADGSVDAYFGKMDMGHGLHVAIGQIVAEELDVPFKAVKVHMGDTATSVNQGGASGSTGIQFGGKQMRMAAAEARRVLVEMAAQKLSVPADQLTVTNGVVQSKTDATKKVSYADLIGGPRLADVNLPFDRIREMTVGEKRDRKVRVTARLTDGSEAVLDIDSDSRCYGEAGFGSFMLTMDEIKSISFKGMKEVNPEARR